MMAQIGKISTILSVSGIGFQLSVALNTFSRGKNVPSELHALARTITSFSLLLKQSAAVLQNPKSVCSSKATDDAQRIAKCSARVFDEVDDMLDEVQKIPSEDAETASDAYEYIKSCFEKRRIQYLLAHIRSLDLSLALWLQIVHMGRKVDLLNKTEDEDQRNINLLAAEQERIIAQDILFVRQVQTAEVYRTYSVLQQAVEQETSRQSSPGDGKKGSDVNAQWVPLWSLGSIEGELTNLFDTEEAMSTISEQTILSLLEQWTALNQEEGDRAKQQPPPAERAKEEDEDYYQSEDDPYSDEEDRDERDYRSRDGRHDQRDSRRPSRGSRHSSAEEDDPRDSRKDFRRHSRLSDRSDYSAGSRDSRGYEERTEQRSPGRRRYDSEDDDGRTRHRRYSDSRNRRSGSNSSPRRRHQSSRSQSRDESRSQGSSKVRKGDEPKPEEKKSDGAKDEEAKKDDGKESTDAKADDDAEDPNSIKINPIAAMLIPTLVNAIRGGSKEDEKANPPQEAATDAPTPQTAAVAPVAQAPAASIPLTTPVSAPKATQPPNIKTATSPRPSPRLQTNQPSSTARDQQRYGAPQVPYASPVQPSSAAQRYTPQSALQQNRQVGAPMTGHAYPTQYSPATPTTQHTNQRPYNDRRQSYHLPPPPRDRYGSDRRYAARPQDEFPDTRSSDNRGGGGHYRGSRPSSPARVAARYDDRIPQSPHSANRPSPTTQYLSPTHQHDGRSPRIDQLSSDGSHQRRYSLPNDRLEPYSPHQPTSPLRRSSQSPPRHGTHQRPPSGEYRRRDSPLRSPTHRRPDSRRRDDRYDRRDPVRASSRPNSRPSSQQSSRPRPAARRDYKYKPSASRVKIKPSNARAASKMLGPIKLNSSLLKGLSTLGKSLARR